MINATGAWADELRGKIGERARLRRLRGSHLILPASRVPLTRSVSFLHPADDRPVFAYPWEGVILVGTTDVDLDEPLRTDPVDQPGRVRIPVAGGSICLCLPGADTGGCAMHVLRGSTGDQHRQGQTHQKSHANMFCGARMDC